MSGPDSQPLFRQSCWACGEPATVRYICWDEPEAPAPAYCDECTEKFPPVMGIGRLRL